MSRPRKRKTVGFIPQVRFFKPQAVPLSELEEVQLDVDELEAIRLTSIKGLRQSEAAIKMDVHQSTLQRVLARAGRKIADALINGKAIRIWSSGEVSERLTLQSSDLETAAFDG